MEKGIWLNSLVVESFYPHEPIQNMENYFNEYILKNDL